MELRINIIEMQNLVLKHKIVNDDYTQYVYDNFDIQDREESIVKIPVDLGEAKTFDWNIGVIYGSSGSGKSSILKKMGGERGVSFSGEKSLISNFDWMEPKEVTFLLTSMGLSSVPTWLRPFHTLSNGEQYRAKLAYLVASAEDDEVLLVDEYTSVVDRDVAKAMSFALQKYIRKINKRIILCSCHYDIMEWLMPDWSYNLNTGGVFKRHEYLRQGRPKINLSLHRVEYDAWNLFKKHHYLTEKVPKSNKFFLFTWEDKPVGIVAVAPLPSGTVKKAIRLSRTVVLPDYQGMGIGSKISEKVSAMYKDLGYRIFTKTVNPALGEYRSKSDKWKATSKNGRVTRQQGTEGGEHIWDSKTRSSYCYEYVGEPLNICTDLLKPVSELRKKEL